MDKEMESSLQQMMAHFLAEMKASYAEMETRAEAYQEKMVSKMEARVEARHERFLARLDGLTSYGKGTTTCHTTSCSEEMDATTLEANPEETEAAVEPQDLIKEEINLENIGSSEDRCEEQRLAVRRRRGAKKRTQDSVGSRQKSSAGRKREISHAIPADRKGNVRKGPGNDGSARGAPKGRRL
jgi:sirohydrochlorin ferrochelatase